MKLYRSVEQAEINLQKNNIENYFESFKCVRKM